MIDPRYLEFYAANGFTLLATEAPPFGVPVFASRVVRLYGFGGSAQGTRRIGVPVVLGTGGTYWDGLNNEDVPSGQIEAWKPIDPIDPLQKAIAK